MENVFWGYVPYGLEWDEETATLLEQEYATKEDAEKAAQERFDDKYKNTRCCDRATQNGYIIKYSYDEDEYEFKRLESHDHQLSYTREPSMESHGL